MRTVKSMLVGATNYMSAKKLNFSGNTGKKVTAMQLSLWIRSGAIVDDDGQVWIKTSTPIAEWINPAFKVGDTVVVTASDESLREFGCPDTIQSEDICKITRLGDYTCQLNRSSSGWIGISMIKLAPEQAK